jgi:hypothetical protein
MPETEPTETATPLPLLDSEGVSPPPEGNDTWEAQNPNREAAKWRTQLRETEAERDALVQRVERLQRLDIERIAAETLAMPGDLFINGNDVSAYITEGCLVDAERVRADAKLLLTERPGLAKNQPAFDPTQGTGGGTKAATPSWDALLK